MSSARAAMARKPCLHLGQQHHNHLHIWQHHHHHNANRAIATEAQLLSAGKKQGQVWGKARGGGCTRAAAGPVGPAADVDALPVHAPAGTACHVIAQRHATSALNVMPRQRSTSEPSLGLMG
eukprot:3590340-Rhodomonas_salina.2